MTPALIVHVAAGGIGIISGFAAVSVRKGGRPHRAFGSVFVVAMLIMAALGAGLAVFGPQPGAGGAPPQASVIVGILTFYLVATAWMTVKRKGPGVGLFEYAAFVVAFAAAAALLVFGLRVAGSSAAARYGAFAAFAALAAGLDLKVILARGVCGPARPARHLWRMCFALFFAASFFFLGQQKIMPASLHGSPVLLALGFAPLLLMIFWLVRVRRGDGLAWRDSFTN